MKGMPWLGRTRMFGSSTGCWTASAFVTPRRARVMPTTGGAPPTTLLAHVVFRQSGGVHQFLNPTSLSSSSSLRSLEARLQCCKSIKELNPLLSRFIVAGLLHWTFFVCRIITGLALSNPSSAFLNYARLLVERCIHQKPNSFLYNTLIRAYSKSHSHGEAIRVYVRMVRMRVAPDNFTFPFVVKASGLRPTTAEGQQVHGHVFKYGFHSDVFVLNTLLTMYSGHGQLSSVRKLFDENRLSVDTVSWNAVIDGYAKIGSMDVARHLFDEMPERNDVSWSTVIDGYARKGELAMAGVLFDRMPSRNIVTWNSMISGFARIGRLQTACKLFDEMPYKNIISWNSIITAYAQSGDMESACVFFHRMHVKDVVSWSAMIAGYVQQSRFVDALNMFKEMLLERDVRPNEVTMVSVLSACAHLSALEQGQWIHTYIGRSDLKLTDNLGAALVDMYAKCGTIETAEQVFWSLEHRNVSAWNALIVGFAMHGFADRSLEAFSQMQKANVRPNGITFLGVLSACSHGGLADEARLFFDTMSKDCNISPEIKHYGCMVDVLGRCGRLEEAEDFVNRMPMQPDIMTFGALLGACRIHGNAEIASRVRDRLMELDYKQSGCHVLMSNIYAAAGKWKEASEIREIITTKGIRKQPGSSLVELNGIVHEFIAADRSHPQIREINSWLDDMIKKLKLLGFVPDTTDVLVDVYEDDKETWLARHSEKLAVAFAIINTVPNMSIRIVKNLRICGDCHSFVKLVSQQCRRNILVRDRNRFHLFKEGRCSCKDYW